MIAGRILVGEFGRPHGVKGLVKLRSFTAKPDALVAYGPLSDEAGSRQFSLALLPGGIARVQGVADRDGASRLTGVRLYVAREALPPPGEDEFYLADLVGLHAATADGAALGRVVSVDDFGAGTFLTLRDAAGRDQEIPFDRACVPVVDVAGGMLTVAPPDEMLVADTGQDDASQYGEGEDAHGRAGDPRAQETAT